MGILSALTFVRFGLEPLCKLMRRLFVAPGSWEKSSEYKIMREVSRQSINSHQTLAWLLYLASPCNWPSGCCFYHLFTSLGGTLLPPSSALCTCVLLTMHWADTCPCVGFAAALPAAGILVRCCSLYHPGGELPASAHFLAQGLPSAASSVCRDIGACGPCADHTCFVAHARK